MSDSKQKRRRLKPAPAQRKRTSRDIEVRWTPKLVKGGWTPISDFFLENYASLTPPLTTAEAMLIVQLMRHKWDAEFPFPAFKTLARRMGISDTAARGHARKLEKKQYLLRIPRTGMPNLFDLSPLFLALEALQEQQENPPVENPFEDDPFEDD